MKNRIGLFIALFICFTSFGQYVNVRLYGAIPDDSGPNRFDDVAIQKAIDENPGRTIFFPAGKYLLSKPITINHSVEILGEGTNNTVIQPVSSNGFVIRTSNVAIKNLFILGYRKPEDLDKNFIGIAAYGMKDDYTFNEEGCISGSEKINRIAGLHFESLRIMDIYTAIELRYVWQSVFDKITTNISDVNGPRTQVAQGIRFYGQCVNNRISNSSLATIGMSISVILDRRDVPDNTPDANLLCHTRRAEGLMISNSFLGSGDYGIYSEGILSMNVSNCTIDLTKRTAIHGRLTDGLLISNNWISSESTEARPIIRILYSNGAHISNNRIAASPKGINNVGVSLEQNTNGCTIIGNTFKNIIYQHVAISRLDNGAPIANSERNNTEIYNVAN